MANDRMRAWLTRPGGLASELVAARGALSMRQLAAKLGEGWGSSRISKFEHGQQLPTAEDLTEIATGLGVSAETLAAWRNLLEEATAKRSLFAKRRGAASLGADNLALTLEAEAGYIRATGPFVIPELLQTAGYAAAVAAASGLSKPEAGQTVTALMERQRILSDPDKAFQFLIPESALRIVPGSRAVVVAQLDRLVSASTMSNVHVAVLPQMEPIEVMPLSGTVTVYDADAIVDDGVEQRHYGASEAARIVERMDDLWSHALRGDAARKRILAVVEDLSAA